MIRHVVLFLDYQNVYKGARDYKGVADLTNYAVGL